MRKLISAVLTMAILLGCAVTVGAETKTVKKVNLFADVPYAGRVADFTAKAGADAAELGYGTYYFNKLDEVAYSSVRWYDKTADHYLKGGDCFIKGHDYVQRIGVAADTGAEFAYTRYVADNGISSYSSHFDEVTLNGETARIRHFTGKDFKKYLFVEREYSAVGEAPAGAIVDTVGVKNIDYPVAGQNPDFDATTVGDFYGLHENSAYAVNWYAVKGEYLISLDEGYVFTAGTTYRVDVTLKASYGYRFKYDNPETPNMNSATINGLMADYAKHYAYVRPIADKELKLSYTFPPCPGDTVSLIEITGLIPPAVGETPSYEAVMLSDAVVFSDYEDSKNKNGACWYDHTAKDFLRTTDTFEEGHEYSVTFELFAADGFAFDKGNVTATVNGYGAEVQYYTEGDTIHYVEYRFAPCFGGDYIASLDITDVVPPVAGETPSYNVTVPDGCTVTYVDWGWEDIQELMEPDTPFENGNTYCFITRVSLADPENFKFSESVAVTVNGRTAEYSILEDGSIWVTYIFPPCGETAAVSAPGDVNTDTKVNLSDVSLMLKHIAGWSIELDTYAADVNDDEKINLSDVSLVLKHIAGWDVVLK